MMLYVDKKYSFLNLRVLDIILLLLFNLLLFEPTLQGISNEYSIIDELSSIMLLLCGIAIIASDGKSRRVFKSSDKLAIALIILSICFALLGNALYHIQANFAPILIDLLTCSKFIATLLSGLIVFKESSVLLDLLVFEAKVLLIVLLVFYPLGLIYNLNMYYDKRFDINSYMFIFTHPTFLSWVLAGILILFVGNNEKGKFWIYSVLILLVLTLRSKSLGFVGCYMLFCIFNSEKRITISRMGIAITAVVLIGWDQIEYYYQSSGFARTELLKTSITIANDYFPFGAGLATFGSAITANQNYYSDLYVTYGLSNVEGLSFGYPAYVSDSFWATVLGQFGWFGCILFLASIIVLFVALYQRSKSANVSLAILLGFIYLIISSTSESAFFNPSAVYLAFCISIVVSVNNFKYSHDKEFNV